MSESVYIVVICICMVILLYVEYNSISPHLLSVENGDGSLLNKHSYGIIYNDEDSGTGRPMNSDSGIVKSTHTDDKGKFSVIIVTFDEPLLNKTVMNVMENTKPGYLYEILIIDDCSTPPVTWDPNDKLVRIVRSDVRMGLIKARFTGGNNAKGDFLAFIDAHVYVGPNWLTTPHRLLKENLNTTVNFINFSLDAEKYIPKKAWQGIGSSASINANLRQFWGGGSKTDDTSPITMGMFATSKFWWEQGQMDPQLKTWGGENVEISLRTWLCGGRILVARDSFVAHGFRSKFPYKVNSHDIMSNYVRIANVWLDDEYRDLFYKANDIRIRDGKVPYDIGDISERLALKERMHCKPFSWYAKRFKDRAMCLPKKMQPDGYKCGTVSTVGPNDLNYLTYEQMFFKNATRNW